MKNLETIQEANQLPQFLTEDWIEQAMSKLDKSKMSSEQRMNYEMMMAKNASIIEILKEEEKKQIAQNTASKLKEKGVEASIISESTGLSIEDIEKL